MPLTEYQQAFLRSCSHRWNIKTGATRSGKTYLDCAVTIPQRILAARDEGLLVMLGNTLGTLERNVLEPMRALWGPDLVGIVRTSASGNIVQLFGRKVYVLGADNKKHIARQPGHAGQSQRPQPPGVARQPGQPRGPRHPGQPGGSGPPGRQCTAPERPAELAHPVHGLQRRAAVCRRLGAGPEGDAGMNTKQKIGRACMIVGILLILGALALLGYNQWDANRADKASFSFIK